MSGQQVSKALLVKLALLARPALLVHRVASDLLEHKALKAPQEKLDLKGPLEKQEHWGQLEKQERQVQQAELVLRDQRVQ